MELPRSIMSLPVQGAWIEMPDGLQRMRAQRSRSPCRERGLKSDGADPAADRAVVAPRAGSVD